MAVAPRLIAGTGGFPALQVKLAAGESFKAVSDAMVSASDQVRLGSTMDGSLWQGLRRTMLGGSDLFLQTHTAGAHEQDVVIAASFPGAIEVHQLEGKETLVLRAGTFLAACASVCIETVADREVARSLLDTGHLWHLRASGPGWVAFAAHGSLLSQTLQAGQVRVIDNGHIVAWQPSVSYVLQFSAADSLWTSWASGEGLGARFTGPGRVYYSTHACTLDTPAAQKQRPGAGSSSDVVGNLCLLAGLALVLVALLLAFLISCIFR